MLGSAFSQLRARARWKRLYSYSADFCWYDEDKYVAISLKAISRRRLEKILTNTHSLNLNACKKYGCTYMRVGSSIDVDGNVIQKAPLFVRVLPSHLLGQVSRPHIEFLASMGINVSKNTYPVCGPGKEKLEIVHGITE
jgi:hypothetical protein